MDVCVCVCVPPIWWFQWFCVHELWFLSKVTWKNCHFFDCDAMHRCDGLSMGCCCSVCLSLDVIFPLAPSIASLMPTENFKLSWKHRTERIQFVRRSVFFFETRCAFNLHLCALNIVFMFCLMSALCCSCFTLAYQSQMNWKWNRTKANVVFVSR